MDKFTTLPPPHPTPPTLTALSVLATLILPILAALYIHQDYTTFLSLGPGGTPSTPLGYLKTKLLALLSLRDPLHPLPVPLHFRPQHGYLTQTPIPLPTRPGHRPTVLGIAPQRQRTQKSSPEIYTALVTGLRTLVSNPSNRLVEGTSCFEKHSSGLFATTPITRTCGGEVCHAHPSDGSLHLSLHPADAGVVIENGWGERHPLAKGGWFRRFVPREFVMVYAPRDEDEVKVVLRIVAGAVWWVSGVDVGTDEGEKDRGIDNEALAKAVAENECVSCRLYGCGRKGLEKMVGAA